VPLLTFWERHGFTEGRGNYALFQTDPELPICYVCAMQHKGWI